MAHLNPLPFLAGAAKAVAARLPFLGRRAEQPIPAVVRSRLDTRKWNPELLKQLEWRRFEELCVAYYEALGFATRLQPAGADGGLDIFLQDPGKPDILARCKAYDAYRVGAKSVQDLRRAMTAAGIHEAALLTSGRFTHAAVDLAAKAHIQLIDGAALVDKLAALAPDQSAGLLQFATQGDFLTPTCPACSIKMVSRQAAQGGRRYWGCPNYPQCKETLSSTPFALP